MAARARIAVSFVALAALSVCALWATERDAFA
jgi:hypothetical protein